MIDPAIARRPFAALDPDALPPHAVPAATLVIVRDTPAAGPPDLLMVRRSQGMAFAAGAAVFPGGRVDDDDWRLAERWDGLIARDDAAGRIAAIRETVEETGLPVAFEGMAPALLADMRAALLAGEPFSHWVDSHDVTLDLDLLVPFARWCPNFREARTFDTRFYATRAPQGDHDLSVCEHENTHIYWAPAGQTLDDARDGRAQIIFPTRRNLERLAQFGSFSELVTGLDARPVQLTAPFVVEQDDQQWLCIPDDHGYPVCREPLTSVRRG